MKDIKLYQIFIFLSTLSRNMLEVFSAVILYKMGYDIKHIFLFFAITYFLGIFSNFFSIVVGNKISYKAVLIISSFLYGITFYYLSIMDNNVSSLIILAFLFSFSSFSYHVIRHYYALKILPKNEKKEVGNILIATYLALIPASYIGAIITNNFSLTISVVILIVFSVLGVVPLLFFKSSDKGLTKIKINMSNISKNSLLFFIFEQFKVVFLVFQPLYLFLFVSSNLEYIGIFNIFLGISSVIFVYFFTRKIDEKKYFKRLNIIFCLILLLKINMSNSIFLLFIAFFEGLGTKLFEIVSANNIYNIDKENVEVNGYLILVEFIFCFIRFLICILGFLFIPDLKVLLYICILGIFICSFVRYRTYN